MNFSRNIVKGIRTITISSVRQATKTAAPAPKPTPAPAHQKPLPGQIPEGYHKLKVIQARFQVKDGKPVFLKNGAMDTFLYRTTWVLVFMGIAGILKLLIGYIFFY